MQTHRASCACGALTLTALGAPERVAMCSCSECRKRTGAPFGWSAYFLTERVTIDGPSSVWKRQTQRGRTFSQHFCPFCGTALYWTIDQFAATVGVAAGCFEGADFPPPTYAAWDTNRLAWIDHIAALERLEEQRT